jgi:glycosyltransferase involved in cell wall biosynthesis
MDQHILLVHNFYQIGGGEHTVFQNEKRLLEESGNFVYSYTRSNEELKQSFWKYLLLPFSTLFSLRTYREAKRLIRKQKIDVVHCHNTFPLISPSIYYACWHMHVPVLQTVHNFRLICPAGTCFRDGAICEECLQKKSFFPALRYGCYRGSRLQTTVVAGMLKLHRILGTYRRLNYVFLTQFNAEKCVPLLHVSKKNVFIKPNFCYASEKACSVGEVNLDKFIFVGRLDDNKGIDLLVRQWLTLPKNYILQIYGTGTLEREISAKIQQYKNIRLYGFQEHDVIFSDWRIACALVFPSICYEGLPMTILESFALGVPVITNGIGNHGALVDDGRTGYCFSIADPTSLASVIELVRENQAMLKQNCLEQYIRFYSPQSNVQELERIYARVLGVRQ